MLTLSNLTHSAHLLETVEGRAAKVDNPDQPFFGEVFEELRPGRSSIEADAAEGLENAAQPEDGAVEKNIPDSEAKPAGPAVDDPQIAQPKGADVASRAMLGDPTPKFAPAQAGETTARQTGPRLAEQGANPMPALGVRAMPGNETSLVKSTLIEPARQGNNRATADIDPSPQATAISKPSRIVVDDTSTEAARQVPKLFPNEISLPAKAGSEPLNTGAGRGGKTNGARMAWSGNGLQDPALPHLQSEGITPGQVRRVAPVPLIDGAKRLAPGDAGVPADSGHTSGVASKTGARANTDAPQDQRRSGIAGVQENAPYLEARPSSKSAQAEHNKGVADSTGQTSGFSFMASLAKPRPQDVFLGTQPARDSNLGPRKVAERGAAAPHKSEPLLPPQQLAGQADSPRHPSRAALSESPVSVLQGVKVPGETTVKLKGPPAAQWDNGQATFAVKTAMPRPVPSTGGEVHARNILHSSPKDQKPINVMGPDTPTVTSSTGIETGLPTRNAVSSLTGVSDGGSKITPAPAEVAPRVERASPDATAPVDPGKEKLYVTPREDTATQHRQASFFFAPTGQLARPNTAYVGELTQITPSQRAQGSIPPAPRFTDSPSPMPARRTELPAVPAAFSAQPIGAQVVLKGDHRSLSRAETALRPTERSRNVEVEPFSDAQRWQTGGRSPYLAGHNLLADDLANRGQGDMSQNVAPTVTAMSIQDGGLSAEEVSPDFLMADGLKQAQAFGSGHAEMGRAAQASISMSSGMPQVSRQVAETISVTTSDVIELVLDPPELGKVRMVMTEQGGTITVAVQADTTATQELFRRHQDLLRQDLLAVGYGTVSFSFGQNSHETGGDRNDQGQMTSQDSNEQLPEAVPIPKAPHSNGVDIRI